jgi:glycosyltransferase involved in cell wall biosynthesis
MRDTTIAVVTALSPSQTTLAEYGLHLLTALGKKPNVRIVALVEDDPDLEYSEIPGVEIFRAWRFNSARNPLRIAAAARRVGADVVLFNAHFTSFGTRKVAAALGLFAPLMVRVTRTPAVTLLHNLVETVDLSASGFGANRLLQWILRLIGTFLTWIVLRSNLVTTTMPRYVEILRRRYGARNVALTPHGSFERPAPPGQPAHSQRILAFGKFGTYKRVEGLIESVRSLDRSGLELVIAGTDSPNAPGYLAGIEQRYGHENIRFTGYVAEEDVERLFRDATVTVFPYTATTGSSGVLHQAGSYGCPPVLPRIGDLEDLIHDEGYTGAFFDPEDPEDLGRAIRELIDDPARRRQIALLNYAAACGLSIDDVADWHLVHIGTVVQGEGRALLDGQSATCSVGG